ncbi:hypothetical protein N8491_02795 [Akkermansiaceae bacterium]|nr:hypothetical protein [Akkermansiaceae bacterium]
MGFHYSGTLYFMDRLTPGKTKHFGLTHRLTEGPNQGMLTSTFSDNADFHAPEIAHHRHFDQGNNGDSPLPITLHPFQIGPTW